MNPNTPFDQESAWARRLEEAIGRHYDQVPEAHRREFTIALMAFVDVAIQLSEPVRALWEQDTPQVMARVIEAAHQDVLDLYAERAAQEGQPPPIGREN